MCFVCIRVLSDCPSSSLFLCQCLCQCGLSEMYTLFTTYSRIIIFVLPDRLTFALITIILFLFSDWMSPFDRVVCGEYPYHCYIGAAVSLKNIGQKFFLHSENRYWRRDYFQNYYLFHIMFALHSLSKRRFVLIRRRLERSFEYE